MDNHKLSTIEQREAFFMSLYKKAFPGVARYVARMGGSLDEAQDIFQDTLIIYYEKVASGQGESITNEKAYLTGIAKMLWLQYYRVNSKNEPLNDLDTAEANEENLNAGKLMHYLATTGKKCMELLKTFYYDNLSVEDVATQFGYSGTRSVTVAKYKCLEKVREKVKQKSLNYADFVE